MVSDCEFRKQTTQVLKGQVIASAFASLTQISASMLTTQEVFGLVDDQPIPDETNRNMSFPQALYLPIIEKEQKASLDTLKFDYLPAKRHLAVRQIMSKHCSMWNSQLD